MAYSRLLELGISKSRGLTAYFSLNQVKTLSFYTRQGGPLRQTPETIRQNINERRELGIETRAFVLIVEGDHQYLIDFKQAQLDVDAKIYLGAHSDLMQLGVDIIDDEWEPGMPPLNLNNFLRSLY